MEAITAAQRLAAITPDSPLSQPAWQPARGRLHAADAASSPRPSLGMPRATRRSAPQAGAAWGEQPLQLEPTVHPGSPFGQRGQPRAADPLLQQLPGTAGDAAQLAARLQPRSSDELDSTELAPRLPGASPAIGPAPGSPSLLPAFPADPGYGSYTARAAAAAAAASAGPACFPLDPAEAWPAERRPLLLCPANEPGAPDTPRRRGGLLSALNRLLRL